MLPDIIMLSSHNDLFFCLFQLLKASQRGIVRLEYAKKIMMEFCLDFLQPATKYNAQDKPPFPFIHDASLITCIHRTGMTQSSLDFWRI